MTDFSRDSMQEVFTFEMNQLVEQLEQIIIEEEESDGISEGAVNEIFRIMHTIKGSSAMMLYDNVASAAHKIEDMFFYIRENQPSNINYSELTDIVLEGIDFIKEELSKIESGAEVDGTGEKLLERVQSYLLVLKGETQSQEVNNNINLAVQPPKASNDLGSAQKKSGFRIVMFFEEDCGMEGARAFNVLKRLEEISFSILSEPNVLEIEPEFDELIKTNGFRMNVETDASEEIIKAMLDETIFLRNYSIYPISANFSQEGSTAINKFKITVHFEDGCEMENVRAYTVVRTLEPIAENLTYEPADIIINEKTIDLIRLNGFQLVLTTAEPYNHVVEILQNTIFLKDLYIEDLTESVDNASNPNKVIPEEVVKTEEVVSKKEDSPAPVKVPAQPAKKPAESAAKKQTGSSMISINVNKLDILLNLTGELVTSEAMVTQNPDLDGIELENFQKAARQLRKIINDIQDTVMSMRMVPLSPTFLKMHRIVRDMCKNLNKDVTLELIGEDTEVDKNIIEHISDPLMHIIRNSIDHGIEKPEKRIISGKPQRGLVVLEAKNVGGDVLIIVKDDGGGINKERVMAKAKANGILKKDESEYTDKEIFNFIFLPGFSTNEDVTSYSGRGVGMDVVTTNIEQVGGSVIVDSEENVGTTTTLKIPLTLAIINGMIIRLGGDKYVIPINAIKESFKAQDSDIVQDPDGNEMIMVRGEMYNVLRLHDFFELENRPQTIDEGIMMMLENDEDTIVVHVDELIGEQQVVVKAIPKYIKKVKGLSGCSLLGNGDISLIVDVAGFFKD